MDTQKTFLTSLVIALSGLTVVPVQAQEAPEAPNDDGLRRPAPNQGHYVALGLSLGGAMADDTGRETRGPGFGPGFSLRLGESITDWADVGIAFAIAYTEADESLTLGRLTVQTQLYLTDHAFVHGGFGFGAGGGPDPQDAEYDRGRYGDVYVAGAGYDFALTDPHASGGWLLTPRATLEVGPDEEFTTFALMMGLELSWWSGLAKDHLDLSFDEAFSSDAGAQRPALTSMNSVNFGYMSLGYERLLDPHHGFLVEARLRMDSDRKEGTESTNYGGSLGYRYHWSGGQDSGFVGLNVRTLRGTGEATVTTHGEERTLTADTYSIAVLPNVGRRWAWDFGLNVTARLGVGYERWTVATDRADDDAVAPLKELLAPLPIAFDGELSAGWSF